MTQRVNFKIAKLLKEKGYNVMPFYIECKTDYIKGYYCEEDSEDYKETTFQFEDYECSHYYLAPTIGEVVDWIFKTYNVWISLTYCDFVIVIQINDISNNKCLEYKDYPCNFKTSEDAYFVAFEQYLKT